MIPPIDPSMLAMLMNSGGGAAGGAGAAGGINFGPQGLLGGMTEMPLDMSALGGNGVTPSSLSSGVDAAVAEPVDFGREMGLSGQTLGSAVGAVDTTTMAQGSGPSGMQMPNMGQMSEIFSQGSSQDMPMVQSPQAQASGYSEAAPQQINPYGSAAANQGLLEMLQKAYSLGA